MTLREIDFRGFSCPWEPLDHELAIEIVGEYARGYVDAFLDAHTSRLEEHGHGVPAVLRAWIERPHDFDVDWDLSLGLVRSTLTGGAPDPFRAAAALALHLSERAQHRVDWELELSAPGPLRCGPWVLPHCARVGVAWRGDVPTLRLRHAVGAAAVDLSADADRSAWLAAGCELVPAFTVGAQSVSLLTERAAGCLAFPAGAPATEPLERALASCRAADALLADHAPIYRTWSARVLRAVSPLFGGDGQMRSSSDATRPGVVGVSFPHETTAIAEMFVHEASHQHFHVVERIEPIAVEGASRRYFSPVKGTERPIDMIVMAYHAFANVMYFYRQCLESGLDDQGYCERNIAFHRGDMEQLVKHLETTDELTPAGRALWEPLHERLS